MKWCRKENDFLNYVLIDRFIDNIDHEIEIDRLKLLTLDERRIALQRIGGSRVELVRDRTGVQLEWTHRQKRYAS